MKHHSIEYAGPARISEVNRMRIQVQALNRNVAAAARRERQRFAQLLHDEFGQHMVLMRLKLGELRATNLGAVSPLIDDLTQLLANLSSLARETTFKLMQPARQADLMKELETLAETASQSSGLSVWVDTEQTSVELPAFERAIVCRIVRELCMNVRKHAQARRVHIVPRQVEGCLHLSVRDDGTGFPTAIPSTWQARRDGGFGLASAQSQLMTLGGRLDVSSEPGRGSCVTLVLPLGAACANHLRSAS